MNPWKLVPPTSSTTKSFEIFRPMKKPWVNPDCQNSEPKKRTVTLQSCTGPVQGQNRVFPVKFSTQGKTCFHYREPLFPLQGPLFSLQEFPCEKTSQGKPCFHYREWVCSVVSVYKKQYIKNTSQILSNFKKKGKKLLFLINRYWVNEKCLAQAMLSSFFLCKIESKILRRNLQYCYCLFLVCT